MAKSQIKKCFTSRFKNGIIVEVDFKQLEVMGLAQLSGDKVLQNDVITKDMHCISAEMVTGHDYKYIYDKVHHQKDHKWIQIRKEAKTPTFQLQYGAGARAIANTCFNGNMDRASTFIKRYYSRYERVKKWQEEVAEEVRKNAKISHLKTDLGYPAKESYYTSVTGRKYYFREYDAPEWQRKKGVMTTFSPTQMKNYPVQGFSTGDIVPIFMGKILKIMLDIAKIHGIIILPIGTIHDSVLFDVKVPDDMPTKKAILHIYTGALVAGEETKERLEDAYGIEMFKSFEFDLEYGPSWGEMIEL